MKFHRIFFIALCFSLLLATFSQVWINTSSPNASAQLDVTVSNKGFLPPRVALNSITDNSTISSPANGLFIYNTASAGSSTNVVTPGYYYFDGSKWQRLINHDKQTTKHTVFINNISASTSSMNGPTIMAVFENKSGSHTYGIRVESGIIVDSNDFCTILVTESNIP